MASWDIRGNIVHIYPTCYWVTDDLMVLGKLLSNHGPPKRIYFGPSVLRSREPQLSISGKFYQQIRGTSMGAPAYAWLHLGMWEEADVYNSQMYLGQLYTWLRYINDVLFLRKGDLDSLHSLVKGLNKNYCNIRLTYTFDQTQIYFLDLLISKDNLKHLLRIHFVRHQLLIRCLPQIAIALHGLRMVFPQDSFSILNKIVPNRTINGKSLIIHCIK